MSVEWISADWPVPDGIIAGTTLRRGGVSSGVFGSLNLGGHVGDDPENVAENRRLFAGACRLPGEPCWLNQSHSTVVARDRPAAPDPGTDALVCSGPGSVCAVLTADCLPVLFAADDGSEVAAAHAGWRGLADGILEATVATMHTPPARILVWFGPAISQPAFEVGAEVRERFVDDDSAAASAFRENERGRFQADLYRLARRRLSGVGVTRVSGGGRCTFREEPLFFSYRRDGQCGRMASFVGIRV